MLMLLEEAARALAARRLRLAVAPGEVARQDGGLMPGVPGRIPVRPADARQPSGPVPPGIPDPAQPPIRPV
jgi:hypothetical protein